ncbi:uncharacterized protein [Amphiura filiformis]|uniref:uncharacterized protein n=1 Tax=Amphiura filiformis TaxID=82378 RepID=UPI003B219D06
MCGKDGCAHEYKNVFPCCRCFLPYCVAWKTQKVFSSIFVAVFIITVFCICSAGAHDEEYHDEWEEYLLCRQCGHEVAKATDLRSFTSSKALHQRNDTILGVENVLIQLFQNPQGRQFEVITTQKADVKKLDTAYSSDTWFPNLSWRIITCPHCRAHLGWSYEPHDHKEGKKDTENTFYGLILNHLIHQEFADSLLVMPKLYGR